MNPPFAILETVRGKSIAGVALLSFLFLARATRADEIRLTDGTKIIGTIVGFENDSFRVETSYGFALIKKDKVADIAVFGPKNESEPKAKSKVPEPPPAPSTPEVGAAVTNESSPHPKGSANASALTPERSSTTASAKPGAGTAAIVKSELTAPKVKSMAAASSVSPVVTPAVSSAASTVMPAAPLPVPPAQPPPPPEPIVIRDEIRGNLYVNLTYGFQIYKPPSWDLIPGARKALPDAVAALGTYDQTTLLVVGRTRAKDSLEAHAAATGKALGEVYDNYRQISSRHLTIAGFDAVEQRSRGTADEKDWSVVLVTLIKGNDAFTLLGMTWADSDLIQVQENVISKTVNSLTFALQP